MKINANDNVLQKRLRGTPDEHREEKWGAGGGDTLVPLKDFKNLVHKNPIEHMNNDNIKK